MRSGPLPVFVAGIVLALAACKTAPGSVVATPSFVLAVASPSAVPTADASGAAAGAPSPAASGQGAAESSPAAPGPRSSTPGGGSPTPGATSTQGSTPAPGGTPAARAGGVHVSLVAGTATSGFADGPGATAQFNTPLGLAFRPDGSLVVVDRENNRIRLVSNPTGNATVATLAGDGQPDFKDGPGETAELNEPANVAVDGHGTIFVSDPWNHRIRIITVGADGHATVGTLVGGDVSGTNDGDASQAQFDFPYGLALDTQGHLFVTERFLQTIRMVSLDATMTKAVSVVTVAGTAGQAGTQDGRGPDAQFQNPVAIAFDPSVTDHIALYVADEDGCHLRHLDLSDTTGTVTSLNPGAGDCGITDGPIDGARFDQPLGLLVDPARGLLVSDATNGALRLMAGNPIVASTILGAPAADGSAGPTALTSIAGMAMGPDGQLYVADDNAIRRIALP